jgi:hypothetical protein
MAALKENRSMTRRAALAAALLALLLAPRPASPNDAAALGTWDVVASTPDGPMPSVMTLARVDGKLKAEVELAGLKRTVSDEALEGDLLKLKVEYEGVLYFMQGKIAGATMEGSWEGGGNSGTLSARKRP